MNDYKKLHDQSVAYSPFKAFADDDFMRSGNSFYATCNQQNFTMCGGYISLIDGMNFMLRVHKIHSLSCPPESITVQQNLDIFIKFLEENPAVRHLPTTMLFEQAVIQAFPCTDNKKAK